MHGGAPELPVLVLMVLVADDVATASPLVAGGLALRDWRICFTICLFISPDFDGYRAPKMKYCPTETHKRSLTQIHRVMFASICFTICFTIEV